MPQHVSDKWWTSLSCLSKSYLSEKVAWQKHINGSGLEECEIKCFLKGPSCEKMD